MADHAATAIAAMNPVGTAEIADKLDELRRFIDRRFAELSTEVHASVQLIDFSENNLSGQIAAMKSQLAEVLAVPGMATRSSGAELEAVVQTTEAAANRIMEAAEAIGDWLLEIGADPALRDRINEKVNTIFEACSFQDLTSQRIRRAIEHLHHVEAMLTTIGTSPEEAARMPAVPPQPAHVIVAFGPDMAQDEIDRMMAG